MTHIWDTFMFRDEHDMLRCRLESMQGWAVTHVLVESTVTHRGLPKPLYYMNTQKNYVDYSPKIHHLVAQLPNHPDPWVREHAQRDAALRVLELYADDDDIVFICDLDEIPNQTMLEWDGQGLAAVGMRTMIYAVDWEVPYHLLPPTCVIGRWHTIKHARQTGLGLAQVRDRRSEYPLLAHGGMHLSWLGGPAKQTEKLETASCHQAEIDASGEGELIRSGERYRTGQSGGGLPVIAVDVDDSWPSYVSQRRCPASWFRPRPKSVADLAQRILTDDPLSSF